MAHWGKNALILANGRKLELCVMRSGNEYRSWELFSLT